MFNLPGLNILAELVVSFPPLSITEIGTLVTLAAALGGAGVWLFGNKFISKDHYIRDRVEVSHQIDVCNNTLLLNQQSNHALKEVISVLSANIKENTAAVHHLDKRLGIVEASHFNKKH